MSIYTGAGEGGSDQCVLSRTLLAKALIFLEHSCLGMQLWPRRCGSISPWNRLSSWTSRIISFALRSIIQTFPFHILVLSASEKSQLFAISHGARRTAKVSKGFKKHHGKNIDCGLFGFSGKHREIELSEEPVRRLIDCVTGELGNEDLGIEGPGRGVASKNVQANLDVVSFQPIKSPFISVLSEATGSWR
ncbi:hypothetical protein BDP27DRAFT_272112 [Rhodocollybia butyracea]|uniref:Uncharacterized protein n=1 Tax=Rhodocollybia butyracea TaxID=206335 RepID=A0A9P5PHP5_9AGAR|nr:hypothetical protein BDP27DRAFT_272112 [Rhodocollybia butyracea]